MTNEWLRNKRALLIGSHDFTPRDYGHLLWHWAIINDSERDYLKTYSKIRGLTLACREQLTVWSHCHKYYSKKSRGFSEDKRKDIEHQWKQFSKNLSLGKLHFLDWLTQEAIDFNCTQRHIIYRYESYLKRYGSIGKQ